MSEREMFANGGVTVEPPTETMNNRPYISRRLSREREGSYLSSVRVLERD